MTEQTIRVLREIGKGESTGIAIMRSTRFPSGTVYPILQRMVAERLVSASAESGDPKALGRPLRKYYRITVAGLKKLAELEQAENLIA